MSKVSILCIAASLVALAVPACDAGSNSETGSNTLPAADAGASNSDDSAAGASGEGGAGAQATDFKTLCERLSAAQCKQFYACFSAAELAPNAGVVGTTEAACVTLFNTASCAGDACPSGEIFNPVNMNKCVDDFAALSCKSFMAIAGHTAANPTACGSLCE